SRASIRLRTHASARSSRHVSTRNGSEPGSGTNYHEDRHYVLSHLRWIRRGCDRARDRARGARSRSSLHQLPAAIPASVISSARILSRSPGGSIPALRVPAVRPRVGGTDARSREDARRRGTALPLRYPARNKCMDRARSEEHTSELQSLAYLV